MKTPRAAVEMALHARTMIGRRVAAAVMAACLILSAGMSSHSELQAASLPSGIASDTLPRPQGHGRIRCSPEAAVAFVPEDDHAWLDLSALLPGFIRDQIELKRFIRDPRFAALRVQCTDTTAIDAIFLRALEIADGDIQYALFIALFGTMDHYRLGLRIPLLGVLTLPLTTESESTFRLRHQHLPKHVLPDSVGAHESDKDKLQHFFGSAYLTYLTHSRGTANLIGNSIEVGEEAFVVGGANDDRDKYANHLGQLFGMRLLEGEDVLPSDILWHTH